MMSFTLASQESAELLSAAIDAALRSLLTDESISSQGKYSTVPAMTLGSIRAEASSRLYVFDQNLLSASEVDQITQIAAGMGIPAPQAYVPPVPVFVP